MTPFSSPGVGASGCTTPRATPLGARPRDAFVAAAHCGTSSSAFKTATKVVGGGASALAAIPIAAKVRATVLTAIPSLRIHTSPSCAARLPYAPLQQSDQALAPSLGRPAVSPT